MKKEKGITLIALVVTIVVLLILAGVSISMLLGENGIITQASEAKKASIRGEEQEYVDLANNTAIQNSYLIRGNGVFTQEELEKELAQVSENREVVVKPNGNKYLITFVESKNEFEIDRPIGSLTQEDWDTILEEAKDDETIQGIGTDGTPVDMSLWKYTEIEGGINLSGGYKRFGCSWSENGYLGDCPDGKIVGFVPQYIRVNGKFQPVIGMESTFQDNKEIVYLPEIPSTVTSIDSICYNSENLKVASIPSTLEYIGSHAFAGCTNLNNVILAKGVKNIGERAFYGCENLSKINLPDTTEELGEQCFANCISLSEIYLPEGLKLMCESFVGCESLTSIEIPSTLEEIWSDKGEYEHAIGPFENCSNLKTLTFREGIKDLSRLHKIDINLNLENVIIPGTVKEITDVFYNNSSLKNVKIGEGTEIIDYLAFENCTNLMSITLPNSITHIKDEAFRNCTNLTNIQLPYNLTEIGDDAFYDCTSLINVQLPDTLVKIGEHAFCGCTNLKNINIPNNIEKIEYGTFYDCLGLTNIIIPNSITHISSGAFNGCINLKEIIIETGSKLEIPTDKWGAENADIVKK